MPPREEQTIFDILDYRKNRRILLLFTQNPCVCQKKAVPLQRKTMQGMAEKKSKSKVNEAPEVWCRDSILV